MNVENHSVNQELLKRLGTDPSGPTKLENHSLTQDVLKLWGIVPASSRSQLKARAKRFESILKRLPAAGSLIQELLIRLSPASSFTFGWNCPNLPKFTAKHHERWKRWEVDDSLVNGFGMVALLNFTGLLNCSDGFFHGEKDPILRNLLLALTRLREFATDEYLSGAYILTKCDSVVENAGGYDDGLEVLLLECIPAFLIDATAASKCRLSDDSESGKQRDERLLSAINELFTVRSHEPSLPSFFRLAEVPLRDAPDSEADNRNQELASKWAELSERKRKIVRAAKEDVAELQKDNLENAGLDPESSYNRTLHKGLCDTGFIIEDNDGRFHRAPGLPIVD
jgi:hypothetical protein